MFRKYIKILLYSLPYLLIVWSISCRSRHTIVCGKVVDQDQKPLRGMLISAAGFCFLHAECIQYTLTDKYGHYHIKMDIPEEFYALNIFISNQAKNPKFGEQYTTTAIFKNGKKVDSYCDVEIGDSTEVDFILSPK